MPACSQCGKSFDVPSALRERYPGWTPSRCRSCHTGASKSAAASHASSSRGRRAATAATTGRAGGGQVASTQDVLDRYTDGPLTGVFTDGSADPNPGPGGWGAVYVRDDIIIDEAHGHEPDTTNNRMELAALIAGYEMVPAGEAATVYSDSRYCVQMINEWADGWARNNWRRKSGPVKNLDLVKQLHALAKARPELTLRWIKAHDGSRWNEYADALSVAYRRR